MIPCADLTADELARLNDPNRTRAEIAADSVQDNAPAVYGIYMYDPARKTMLSVAAPPPGFMYTDPIALQARTEPNAVEPVSNDDAAP